MDIAFRRQAPILVIYSRVQALMYLRMSNCQVALLFNFDALRLKDGLLRFLRSRQGGEALPT